MPIYSRRLSRGIRFFYKFDYNGNTYRSQAIYYTKHEAKKAEADRFSNVEKIDKSLFSENIEVELAIKERIKQLSLTASNHYKLECSRHLDIFKDKFKNRLINKISKKEIYDFILELADDYKKKGNTNSSINEAIKQYKSFYYFVANRFDIDLKNPFSKYKYFPVSKNIKYIPSDKDINKVISICDEKQSLLIKFVMETGCRINEALNLLYGDIYDDYIVLYTRKSKYANRTPRKIPKPKCLKDLNGKPDERVFSTWTNRPTFLKTKTKSLGIKSFGFHNLRHRYASKLSKAGVPIFEIMSKLGHTSINTSQIYLQLLGS